MRRAKGNASVTSTDKQENLLSGALRIVSGIRDDHPIAVEAPAQKLIGRTPEIQSEAAVIEFPKFLHHGVAVMIQIDRPLLKGQKIAETVVKHLLNTQRRGGHLVEKIVEDKERMVPAVDIFHHER